MKLKTVKSFTAGVVAAVGIFGAICSAHAAPVPYDIVFTQTEGSTSQSGSFVYDATTKTFSDFEVTWEGTVVDLTSEANTPMQNARCPAMPSGGSLGFAIMSGNTTCPSEQLWNIKRQPGGTFFNFFASDAPIIAEVAFMNLSKTISHLDPALVGAELLLGGQFIIAEQAVGLPEPGTLALLGLGLAGLGLSRRRH